MPTTGGPLIEACDEIVTAINAESWGETFTAVRVYRPTNRLEDLAALSVQVCLPSRKRERVARGVHADVFRVVVGVQKQLSPTSKQADADELMEFADALSEFLTKHAWTFGTLKTIEEIPSIHPDRYDLDGVFTRAIALTFDARELIR